jgi:hypothetical protein
MKKLSDFIISYVTESSVGTGGSFYYMPATGGASAPTSAPTTSSPTVSTDPGVSARVKSRKKQTEQDLLRYKRVAERQSENRGSIDPGVESRIEELEKELTPEGQVEVYKQEAQKRAEGIERVKSGKTFDKAPFGTFTITPKTAAEQEAYDAASIAFQKQLDKAPREEIEKAFEVSREKSKTVDVEREGKRKISPVYNVTQSDFEKATGQKYDPTNPEQRQAFFDIVSRGKPTWSTGAGPGEAPAYGTKSYYTMRARPGVGEPGEGQAWYDTETGQLSRSTPESRERIAQKIGGEKFDAEWARKDEEIRRKARETVAREQGLVSRPGSRSKPNKKVKPRQSQRTTPAQTILPGTKMAPNLPIINSPGYIQGLGNRDIFDTDRFYQPNNIGRVNLDSEFPEFGRSTLNRWFGRKKI